MTDSERKRLLGYYRSLNGVERNLREQASRKVLSVDAGAGDAIAEEIDRLEGEFPGLGPPSRVSQLKLESMTGYFYRIESLLAKVSLVLGRLSVATEADASTPVTEVKEFPFVQDVALRRILERDYVEIQQAYVASCWKSVIILAGGAIEAILLDLALRDATRARASVKAPKESNLTKWDLHHLIAVCVDHKLVTEGVERLSSPVREYRNLVHPGNELRSGLVVEAQEARIALEVLNIVHRDLS
jgi:hypothetical protein